jgi:hypothetical protein
VGHEADYAPPSSAEVKECVELYLHSNTPSWCGAQLKKPQGQLYLYLFYLIKFYYIPPEIISTSVPNPHDNLSLKT